MATSTINKPHTVINEFVTCSYNSTTELRSAKISPPSGYNAYYVLVAPLPFNTTGTKIDRIYKNVDSGENKVTIILEARSGKTFDADETLQINVAWYMNN